MAFCAEAAPEQLGIPAVIMMMTMMMTMMMMVAIMSTVASFIDVVIITNYYLFVISTGFRIPPTPVPGYAPGYSWIEYTPCSEQQRLQENASKKR